MFKHGIGKWVLGLSFLGGGAFARADANSVDPADLSPVQQITLAPDASALRVEFQALKMGNCPHQVDMEQVRGLGDERIVYRVKAQIAGDDPLTCLSLGYNSALEFADLTGRNPSSSPLISVEAPEGFGIVGVTQLRSN